MCTIVHCSYDYYSDMHIQQIIGQDCIIEPEEKKGLKWKFFQKKIPKSSYPDGAACCLAKKNFKKCWIYINVSPISAHGTLWWCECKL